MDRSRLVKRIIIWKDRNLTKGKIFKFLLLFAIVATVMPVITVLLVRQTYQGKIYTNPADITHYKVAIVFGTTVSDNTPSIALQDRIDAAVTLYKQGKVEKIIMSGNGTTGEPQAMVASAVKLGIPATALFADLDSTRTFDTCYRARNVFDIGRAVLISQTVHLERALYLCNSLGVNSIGFAAAATTPEDSGREFFSYLKAFWDINLGMPAVSTADPIAM